MHRLDALLVEAQTTSEPRPNFETTPFRNEKTQWELDYEIQIIFSCVEQGPESIAAAALQKFLLFALLIICALNHDAGDTQTTRGPGEYAFPSFAYLAASRSLLVALYRMFFLVHPQRICRN